MSNDESLVHLLADLVAIPSMNPMGRDRSGAEYSEERLAAYVSDYLRRHSIDVNTSEVAPHRPNVIGYVDAGAKQTVLLEAHLDTVHADNMTIEPFSPKVLDGRLYGRGACDTKASLASFLHTVGTLAKNASTLKFNIVIAAVSDEEYGFTGARRAVENGLVGDFGIAGEPTQLRIVRAHKGVVRWRIITKGTAAHSAYPDRGDNAIYTMGHVLVRLQAYGSELMQGPRHAELGTPTLSVGVIEGGQAVNIVPDRCWIEIDRRTLPGETENEILQSAESVLQDVSKYEFEPPHISIGGIDVSPENPLLQRLAGVIEEINGECVIETAQYATNAGVYNQSGIPTIVFGPGNIAQAHTAAEYVEVDQVIRCCEILSRFLTT
ncbi:MAG: M20 family metallopeptidase [Ignavibacteriae bacterium]|nr:M20 family metallopeptidase [Ignavibacteriota bacterium]